MSNTEKSLNQPTDLVAFDSFPKTLLNQNSIMYQAPCQTILKNSIPAYHSDHPNIGKCMYLDIGALFYWSPVYTFTGIWLNRFAPE